MGGALIIMALAAGTLLWCDLRSTLVWLALLVTVGYGAIGFVDDYLKLSRKNKKGLPGKLKLLGQFVIGVVAMIWLYTGDALPPEVAPAAGAAARELPPHVGDGDRLDHAAAGRYVGFAVFVLVAESNAVNLTDGLDGLAIGPVIIYAFTFLFLAYAAGTTLRDFNIAEYLGMAHVPGASELAVFCGAMVGAGIGFLWFNTYPAQVFMGDVGALALGGALGFVGAGDQERAGAADHRRRVRRRGGQRHHPGRLLQADQEAHLPDGADPPPLREAGLARVQNRRALLDRLVRLRDSRPRHHAEGEMRACTWISNRQTRARGRARALRDRGGAAVRGARRARDRRPTSATRSALGAALAELPAERRARAGRPPARDVHRRRPDRAVAGRARAPGAGGGARGGRADHRRDGARVALRVEHADRDHRHQRQVDDHDAGGRHVRATGARRSWAATWATRWPRRSGRRRRTRGGVWSSRCPASSSRRSTRFRPHVAVLLNVTADHLDRYPDMDALRGRQGAHLRGADRRRLRGRQRGRPARGRRQRRRRRAARIGFSVDARRSPEGGWRRRATRWSSRLPGGARRTLPGDAARRWSGATTRPTRWRRCSRPPRRRDARAQAQRGLLAFRPLAHRMELVADADGVAYYDDSKGTNVGAVVAALDGFPRPVVLIAGGRDKGGDYAPLAAALRARRPRRGAHRRGGRQIAGRAGAACCPSSAPRRWTTRSRRPPRSPSPATPWCCRRRAPASTCSATTRTAPRCSARPSRASPREGARVVKPPRAAHGRRGAWPARAPPRSRRAPSTPRRRSRATASRRARSKSGRRSRAWLAKMRGDRRAPAARSGPARSASIACWSAPCWRWRRSAW